jgi:hypothetical protein
LPQSNVLFQIDELAIFDPLAPNSYYSTWHSLTGSEGGSPYFYQFCPAVTSIAVARRFGVAYVLEPHDTRGPTGSAFVEAVGDERLYRIPGAAPATIVRAPASQPLPPDNATGTPVAVHHPNPATWSLTTDAATTQVVRLRITDVPGWHATIDGRPLALRTYSGVMLQARIPAGHHTVVVRYWPSAFTAGLVLAVCSIIGLSIASVGGWIRRRRSRPSVN